MAELSRKFLYRIFCVLALLVSVYLVVDLAWSKTLDVKVMLLFGIFLAVLAFGFIDWFHNDVYYRRQEEELKMYQLYIKPLEELTKDIRAKQHEFDNHMNAILNMHVAIDNYEELVKAQSAYIKEMYDVKVRSNPALLRISDKILAGFLYSKIISAPSYINIDVQVLSQQIITSVSEHSLVEIIGVLVDNAFEACTEELHDVDILLDAKKDKLIFAVKNKVKGLTMGEVAQFFEKGHTTKRNKEGHGLGLYQAKLLAQRYDGTITVELQESEGMQEICFRVEI